VGATVWYSVSWHTVSRWHTRSANDVGALKVYWSFGQLGLCVEQSRSDDFVGCVDSHSSFSQVVSGAHVLPFALPDHVPALPRERGTTQGAHCRSVASVPSVVLPLPMAQVRQAIQSDALLLPSLLKWRVGHGVHCDLPVAAQEPAPQVVQLPAPNCATVPPTHRVSFWLPSHEYPAGHAAHSRSVLIEGASVSYSLLSHVCTATHGSASLLVLKVLPATQGAHALSEVDVPSIVLPDPSLHVRHAAHAVAPAPEKCLGAHGLHAALPALENVPAAQGEQALARCLDFVPAGHVEHVALPGAA